MSLAGEHPSPRTPGIGAGALSYLEENMPTNKVTPFMFCVSPFDPMEIGWDAFRVFIVRRYNGGQYDEYHVVPWTCGSSRFYDADGEELPEPSPECVHRGFAEAKRVAELALSKMVINGTTLEQALRLYKRKRPRLE